MTAIALRGLTKRFGATTAVDGIDLDIRSGELFFLLGPSGCGKTTLLRMIAGFIEPTSGLIRFGARDVTLLPPNRRNAGMVFQSYALWPHMTVEENVAYGLKVRKIPSAPRADRVQRALRAVHMEALAQRKPNQLSGGQQQRIALARALVIEPTVLLLDEPLSNLDAKLRLEMRSEIRRICTETGITAVYVTHDQKEALSMADRMAVLHAGRVMQIGAPRELYDRPNSRFVADFLGETNFIAAVVRGHIDGAIELETGAGRLLSTAPPSSAPAAPKGAMTHETGVGFSASASKTTLPAVQGNVTCSIRPEAIRLSRSPVPPTSGPPAPAAPASARSARAAGTDNTLRGTRRKTIFLGESAQHEIALEDGTTVNVLELKPADAAAADEAVQLHVSPSDIVILAD